MRNQLVLSINRTTQDTFTGRFCVDEVTAYPNQCHLLQPHQDDLLLNPPVLSFTVYRGFNGIQTEEKMLWAKSTAQLWYYRNNSHDTQQVNIP